MKFVVDPELRVPKLSPLEMLCRSVTCMFHGHLWMECYETPGGKITNLACSRCALTVVRQ
jgi:hypothetical protein